MVLMRCRTLASSRGALVGCAITTSPNSVRSETTTLSSERAARGPPLGLANEPSSRRAGWSSNSVFCVGLAIVSLHEVSEVPGAFRAQVHGRAILADDQRQPALGRDEPCRQ